MPCRCDYMEPSMREKESHRACHLLTLFHGGSLPAWVHEGAKSIYGSRDHADEATAMLCALCEQLDDDVIYDGRNPNARKLADWWDEHKANDRKRMEKELNKYSPAELKLIKEILA